MRRAQVRLTVKTSRQIVASALRAEEARACDLCTVTANAFCTYSPCAPTSQQRAFIGAHRHNTTITLRFCFTAFPFAVFAFRSSASIPSTSHPPWPQDQLNLRRWICAGKKHLGLRESHRRSWAATSARSLSLQVAVKMKVRSSSSRRMLPPPQSREKQFWRRSASLVWCLVRMTVMK